MSDKKTRFENEIEKEVLTLGDYAMEQARKNDTYIVYINDDGEVVREYPDGRIVKVCDCQND